MSDNENNTDSGNGESNENSRDSRGSRGGSGGGDRRGSRGPSRGGNDRRGGGGGRRRGRKRAYYCPEGKCFDYKDVNTLERYLTEVGKIKPRRQTGNCARCQRELAREVKRARHIALLPFVVSTD